MANKNLREMFQEISENIELGEFNIEDIPNVELPENFNTEFHNKYLTFVAAKNNPELMGHFKGKYLSSSDLKIKNGFIAMGGSEEVFNELKKQEPDSLKLVDLVFDKVKELKIPVKPVDNDEANKAHKKYKEETALQIEGLLKEKENFESNTAQAIADNNSNWKAKFTQSRVNELLSGKSFDSTLDPKDVKYLINRRIEDSDYLVKMQDDGSFKVFDRENPESEKIKDGKNVSLSDIITEFSTPYIKKNDQPNPANPTPVKQVVVDTATGGDGDGRYIVGHADYGKK